MEISVEFNNVEKRRMITQESIDKNVKPIVIHEICKDKIVESVRKKMLVRSEFGQKKYGTTMQRTDFSRLDWMKYAQEEAMDFAVYLERMIQDEEKNDRSR